MRFAPESNHGANAGLLEARDFMEAIHKKHPWISYSDLWTLGGVAAVQEMGGPKVSSIFLSFCLFLSPPPLSFVSVFSPSSSSNL